MNVAMATKAEIASLVMRARQGSQNDAGSIAEVRKAAMAGGKRAGQVYSLILAYIHSHPVPGTEAMVSKFRKSPPPALPPSPSPSNDGDPVTLPEGPPPLDVSAMGEEAVGSLVHLSQGMGDEWITDPENLFALCAVPSGGKCAVLTCAAILADGPSLTNKRLEALGDLIEDQRMKVTFLTGIRDGGRSQGGYLSRTLPEEAKRIYDAGRSVGVARGIQAVRGGGPLSAFCDMVAWELNEVA